jgi:hypothetical protein
MFEICLCQKKINMRPMIDFLWFLDKNIFYFMYFSTENWHKVYILLEV